jgi:hypothetical protein
MVLFRRFSIGLTIQSCKKINHFSNDLYAELEKSSTYSHTWLWLGLNPQLGELSQGLSCHWFILFFTTGTAVCIAVIFSTNQSTFLSLSVYWPAWEPKNLSCCTVWCSTQQTVDGYSFCLSLVLKDWLISRVLLNTELR